MVHKHPFIENEVYIDQNQKYAAIIGLNPTQGARSPLLWNAAYKYYDLNIKMYPFDVLPENLSKLLDYLNETPYFLGGAIAVPYKEAVSNWLMNKQSTEVAKIGAVNCIARSDDGKLWGYNTDGEASIFSFEKKFGSVAGKSVLILGCGGAAKAVSTYFKKYTGSTGKIIVASRKESDKNFTDRIKVNWINWDKVNSILSEIDIVINCTSVGHGAQFNKSPLSIEQLQTLNRNCIIFDIIYQVEPNLLFNYTQIQKLKYTDGSDMNVKQAVMAFCNVNKEKNINIVFTEIAMSQLLFKKT